MAIPLQKFRELVFQMLYSHDVGHGNNEDILVLMMKELSVTKKGVKEAQTRIDDLLKHKEEIDAMIKKASRSYEFNRIQVIERNILRLGVYELFFEGTIPPKVIIAEAMRLGRKFSTPQSSLFINAILDYLYKLSQGEVGGEGTVVQAIEAMIESEQIAEEAAQTKPLEGDEEMPKE
jgi:N utilization substance protein B